jgi:hypothetical protein
MRPAWLPDDVLGTYVRAFECTGFEGGLMYYRNIDANWRVARRTGPRPIRASSLFVTGSDDPINDVMPVDRSAHVFDDLRVHVVDGAGRRVHLERPDQVNEVILGHLRRVPASVHQRPEAGKSAQEHQHGVAVQLGSDTADDDARAPAGGTRQPRLHSRRERDRG